MSTPLDFAALLSRNYQPAKLTQIQPKADTSRRLEEHYLSKRRGNRALLKSSDDGDNIRHRHHAAVVAGEDGVDGHHESVMEKLKRDEETNSLVMSLVSKTPTFRLLNKGRDGDDGDDGDDDDDDDDYDGGKGDGTAATTTGYSSRGKNSSIKSLSDYIPIPPQPPSIQELRQEFSPKFHNVELDDWESKIDWDGDGQEHQNDDEAMNQKATAPVISSDDGATAAVGVVGPDSSTSTGLPTIVSSSPSSRITKTSPNDPMALLDKRRNPFLDNMSFENMVSWSGDPVETAAMAAATPLILELGVAGQSIAKSALPTHRPESFADSDAYRHRLHAEQEAKNTGGGTGAIKTAADAARVGTFAEKEETKKFIEQQQKRRRELEKSKTKRVRDAMSSLGVMGSGRGRAITSSLMGPGGTERTGRAARLAMGQTGPQEYIEQLDMVVNHNLIKDPMSIVTLREFHRPKLPLTIVRTTLVWQFCIRHLPGKKGKKGGPGAPKTGGTDNAVSYQALMMGNQPGAISKTKLRTENDLTPTEGDLVLLEFSEERPPIQLGAGGASKIVTYYRGDKSKCPVSRGGGDRPVRRKRAGPDATLDKKTPTNGNDGDKLFFPRLVGPNLSTSITDWVGKAPKRSKDDRKNEFDNVDVLPEGVTEILHPKARGPFLGEILDGESVTGLITNMFVAPIFQQTVESTDFLMILGRNAGASAAGRQDTLKVVLREMPSSVFTVGQTEPRTKVFAPSTQSEKVFVQNWNSYQIAKYLATADAKRQNVTLNALHSHFYSIEKGVLRTRIKAVANYDKPNNLYTLKRLGEDGFVGVDRLGRSSPINPENVTSYRSMLSFLERLRDLGMEKIFNGQHAVTTVEMAFAYLAAQANTAKDLARKLKKHIETVKTKKGSPLQLQFYENAASELDALSKTLNRKKVVAKFIYDEMQLSPWNLTGQFIDGTHGKRDMMMLTGLGDPSGVGEGFSFLREETKARSGGGGASAANTGPKITGTDDDLRKLTMKQMGNILKTFGLKEKEIKPLKRWDRVHVIRDLSTKQAADGAGDSLERFARGEKKKTKDQQADYKQRINVIWKRQIAALSATDGSGDQPDGGTDQPEPEKDEEAKEVSDSDEDDDFDDFAAEFEDDLMDQKDTNAIIASQQAGGAGGDFKIRKTTDDKDLSKDARELAAFKRQQEEERVAQSNFGSAAQPASVSTPNPNRKVVRQRITTTYPDGRQVTKFKFIMNTEIVGKIMNKIDTHPNFGAKSKVQPEYVAEDKQLGHAMFEEEDSFIWSTKYPGKRNEGGKKDGRRVRRTRPGVPQKKKVQVGRLKPPKAQKRKRADDDESEVFAAIQKRQTTSNRKERGSIRQRRPHIIFAKRLEEIWSVADNRPSATPFQKPVDRRHYPSYYEMVSHPMDLGTIKKKIDGFQYASTESMLKDFELMKNNTIKYNGNGTVLAEEADAMYNVVKKLIDQNSAELSHLEEAAAQVMGKKTTKAKGKKKKTTSKKKGGADDSDEDEAYSVDLNLDELSDSD